MSGLLLRVCSRASHHGDVSWLNAKPDLTCMPWRVLNSSLASDIEIKFVPDFSQI